jgi:hypothetical protein
MNVRPSPFIVGRGARRGVLLLVVLSLLTLFLMLGAAYVVSATRAREAARAYARLTFAGDEARVPHARLLDGVLLRVVRGGAAPKATISPSFESLLADKYGTVTLEGTASGFDSAAPSPAVLTGTLTLTSPVRPFDLNGRLVSFVEPGRPVTTHRIIRAGSVGVVNTATTVVALSIDASSRPGPFVGPKATTRAIINGREFDGSTTNEPWDGFDGVNPFIARVSGTTISGTTIISRSSVSRISYFPTLDTGTLSATLDRDSDLIPDAADNDNDGDYDGVFMDFDIPDTTDAYGNTVNLRASVLIVDLDGRFNVNAHGSLTPLYYTNLHPGWPSGGIFASLGNVPLGSGYGPAEIQANLGSGIEPRSPASVVSSSPRLFDNSAMVTGTTLFTINVTGSESAAENPKTNLLVGLSFEDKNAITKPRQRGRRPTGSRYTSDQETWRLRPLEGRYGEMSAEAWISGTQPMSGSNASFVYARPGIRNLDDPASYAASWRVPYAQLQQSVSFGLPPVWWVTGTTISTGAAFNWWAAISGTVGNVVLSLPPPRGIFNAPPDLHGRMKTLTRVESGVVPAMVYAKPEWPVSSGTARPWPLNSGTFQLILGVDERRETYDDPYECAIDTRRGAGGFLHDPVTGGLSVGGLVDNPFTAAELEPVLRPYDIDTNRLPSRLPGILGSVSEVARLRITTDSWDTTAITGSAATVLSSWVSTASGTLNGPSPVAGVIAGDVARGERFDLNRPLAPADVSNVANVGWPTSPLMGSPYHLQRAAYCKDLYTLLMAYGAPQNAAQLAQWAANVAEFRDADSRIVPFEYDANPLNGWDVDGDVTTPGGGADRQVVWGAERPEMVIQEAFAWRNSATGDAGMCFTLHRPWNAVAYGCLPNNTIPAEPCDYAFDVLADGTVGKPQNIVNLGKKAAADLYSGSNSAYHVVSGTTYPIWRMRIVAGGSTNYVRFDANTAQPQEFVDSGVNSGDATAKMGTDQTITFMSGATVVTGSGTAKGAVSLRAPDGRIVSGLRVLTGTIATLSLDRLSDPTLPLTTNGTIPGTSITGSAVWFGTAPDTAPVRYVTIDSATVTVNETQTSVDFSGMTWRRLANNTDTDFWRSPSYVPVSGSNGQQIDVLGSITTGSTAWLPWPNRPFVSSAELLLVPQGSANELLQNYRRLTPALSGSVQLGWSIPVPTRLLLDAVHVPTRFAGIHRSTTQNFSAVAGIFNTVTTVNQLSSFREPGRVNLNTVLADDVWNAVVAGPLPAAVKSRPAASTPAQCMAAALALTGGATGTAVSDPASPQLAANLNPLHEIYTASRLANTVTPRSNVFAIWITLRESVANDPDSVRYRRAFYIVDRSIPVAFENGRDTNVWDCVRVRRIIE